MFISQILALFMMIHSERPSAPYHEKNRVLIQLQTAGLLDLADIDIT